mmetsp:Transcript_32298/g.89204  ORF Transcript_32298/g.89204 Transcript_32298/m.89204 type:complete len:205 (-) Transcript_32298:824-1438(-)
MALGDVAAAMATAAPFASTWPHATAAAFAAAPGQPWFDASSTGAAKAAGPEAPTLITGSLLWRARRRDRRGSMNGAGGGAAAHVGGIKSGATGASIVASALVPERRSFRCGEDAAERSAFTSASAIFGASGKAMSFRGPPKECRCFLASGGRSRTSASAALRVLVSGGFAASASTSASAALRVLFSGGSTASASTSAAPLSPEG